MSDGRRAQSHGYAPLGEDSRKGGGAEIYSEWIERQTERQIMYFNIEDPPIFFI